MRDGRDLDRRVQRLRSEGQLEPIHVLKKQSEIDGEGVDSGGQKREA